jgi:uncharacterized membrane protein
MLYSVGLFGLGAGLLSPFAGRLALGAGPLAVALVGTHHQDYRYRRGKGGVLTPEREARTSNLPFQALVSGRNEWAPLWDELKLVNCGVALGVAALMFLNRSRSADVLKQVSTQTQKRTKKFS